MTFTDTLKKESEHTRNIALDNYIAGMPTIAPPEEIAQKEIKVEIPEPTVKQEVMSRLNLVDENFNYTDTYTNYINKGGTPPPGYEYAHNQILQDEKVDNLWEQVNNNEISYDTALMEAYGKDLLKGRGINTDSVGYWMSKYNSNDFSNPYDNKVLMMQIREEANQLFMAKQVKNAPITSTSLSNLVNKELTHKQVRDIFGENWDDSIKELSDNKLMEAIYTDTLNSTARLVQDEKGTFYYLYNDGKLYKLDNLSGTGHAQYDQDSSGNITGIYIGGKGETHINAFTSGLGGVFTSIVKFVANLAGTGLEAGSSIFTGDFDWSDATKFGRNIDIYLNKNVNWVNSSGYVDLNQDFTMMDFTHMAANLAGSIVGVYMLGGGMSALEKTSLPGAKYIAKGLKWQTGNFGNVSTTAPFITKIGTRAGTAAVYNVKDFLQNVQKISEQNALLGDKVEDDEIFKQALGIFGVNMMIDTLFGGGIDDNTYQTYTGRDASKKAYEGFKKVQEKYTRSAIVKRELDEVSNAALNSYLKSNRAVIKFNSVLDFISNYLTAAVSSTTSLNEKGEFKELSLDDFNPFNKTNMALLLPAAVNSYAYSYRGQTREYNVAFDNLRGIHTKVLDTLDSKIESTTNPKERETLINVRADYINKFNESESRSAEGRVLAALDTLANNGLEDFSIASIEKVIKPAKIQHLRKSYEAAEMLFEARLAQANDFYKPENNNMPKLKKLFNGLTKKQSKEAVQTTYGESYLEKNLEKYSGLISFKKEVSDAIDSISKGVTETDLNTLGSYSDFTDSISLKQKNKDLYDELSNTLGSDEMDKSTFIVIDNSRSASKEFSEVKSAYKVCADLGLIETVKSMNDNANVYRYVGSDHVEQANKSTALNSMVKAIIQLDRSPSDEFSREVIKNAMTIMGVDSSAELLTKTTTAVTILKSLESSKAITPERAALIFESLQKNGDIDKSDYSLGISGDKSTIDAYSLYSTEVEVLQALSIAAKDPEKFKSMIDLSDKKYITAIENLLKTKGIPEELKQEIGKVTNESFFHSGDTKGFYSYIKHCVENHFTSRIVSPEEDIPISDDTITKEDIKLYISRMKPKDLNKKAEQNFNKEMESLTSDIFNTWNELYKGTTKAVDMKNDLVILDIRNLTGRFTDKLIRELDQKNQAGFKDLNDPKKVKNKTQIAREFNERALLIKNNSPIITFDLKNQEDINLFNSIMKKLNYDFELKSAEHLDQNKQTLITHLDTKGLNYSEGSLRVIDLPRRKNISDILFNAFKKGFIELGNTTQKLNEYELIDYAGNKATEPDIITTILSDVELKNIKSDLHANITLSPLLEVLPFNPSEEYRFDTIVTSILKGENELPIKTGKIAGSSEAVTESLPVKTVATVLKQNEDLANYFAITMVIDHFCDNNSILPLNEVDFNKLKSEGIIDSKDSFWESHGYKSRRYITLKDNSSEARVRMKKAILDQDFNLLKIMPFINYTAEQGEQLKSHGYIDSNNAFNINYGDLAGNGRKLGLDIFNLDFPWDDDSRTFARKFFDTVLAKGNEEGHFYNPLKDSKLENPNFDDASSYKIYEPKEYKAFMHSIKNKKDPYSLLIKTYIDTFNSLVKQKQDSPEDESWRILLKNRKVLEAFNSKEKLEDADIQNIQTIIKNITPQVAEAIGVSTQRPLHTSRGTVVEPGYVPVSADVLANIFKGYDNIKFVHSDGTDWEPTVEDIKKAFDFFTLKKTEIINNNSLAPLKYFNVRYIENNATKLLTLAASNDGYFRIEDAEQIAQLISSNFNEVLSNQDASFVMTKDPIVHKTLALIFGEQEYKNACDIIFRQAKKNMKIQGVLGATTVKKNLISTAASQELTPKQALTAGGASLFKMEDLIKNNITSKQNKDIYGYWNKLGSQTKNYNKYALINSANRDRVENVRLYEQSHGNYSKSFVYAKNRNAQAPAYTISATYEKMKNEFKNIPTLNISNKTVQENLMDTSILLNDLIVGRTDYSGKSTKYVFMDRATGKVKDLNDFSAENLSELLVKVVNNKEDLKNSIILTADPKAAGSTTALDIKYKDLSNEADYKSFVSDLYLNWCIENESLLKHALEIKDDSLFLDLVGGQTMNMDKIARVLKDIPVASLSEKEETKLIWEQVKDLGVDIDKKNFYKLFKYALSQEDSYADAKDKYQAATTAIIDALDIDSSYTELSEVEKERINFMIFGLAPTMLSKNQEKALRHFKSTLQNEILNAEVKQYMNEYFEGKTYMLPKLQELAKRNKETKQAMLLQYLYEDDSAATIDLIARNKSLVSLFEERNSKRSSSKLVISSKGDTMDTQVMKDVFESITTGNKNTSDISTLIVFDTEASNKKHYVGDKEYAFNAAFLIYKYKDGKWEVSEEKFNIDNGMTADEWINKYVEDNAFYRDNSGYRSDIEEYRKGKLTKPEDIKNIISGYIDPNKTLLIGHNIDKADTPWLLNREIFTEDLLKSVRTIDTVYVALNNLRDNRARKALKKTDLLDSLNLINKNESNHSAMVDAEDTFKILNKLVDLDYNMNKLKTLEIKNLEDFATKLGVKIDKEDLMYLDSALAKVREDSTSISQAFNSKYEITSDSVAIIKDAFDYHLKKDYMKLISSIRKADQNFYALSPKAQTVLVTRQYDKIFKLFSYADANDIPYDKIVTTIKHNIKGLTTEENILLTIGDKLSFNKILKDLNITEQDIEPYKAYDSKINFEKNILDSNIVNSADYEMYKNLKGTLVISNGIQEAMDALDIEDDSINNLLTSKFLTFYDIDSSVEDPERLLNESKPDYIKSKYDKVIEEVLSSRFGDVKALYDIPQKGKYGLITSFTVGDIVKDLIGGSEEKGLQTTLDSSMVVITKNYFESLMGMTFKEYKLLHPDQKELYTNMIIHPADGNGKIAARRVIVVDSFNDSKQDFGVRIPETFAETLLSRDFDGDHVVIVQPEDRSQALLKAYANRAYAVHDIQEKVLTWLKMSAGLSYGDSEEKGFIRYNIGRNEDILRLCVEADQLLSQGQDVPTSLTSRFEAKVKELLKDSNLNISVDKVKKELWVKEISTDFYEDNSKVLKFINNPGVTLSKDFSATYSAKQKRYLDSLAQQRSDLYTIIDSTTGEEGKKVLFNYNPEIINKPYMDFISNNIYASKIIQNYLENLSTSDKANIDSFINVLTEATSQGNFTESFKKVMAPTMKAITEDLRSALTEGNTNKAFVIYDVYLRTLEDNMRRYHSTITTKEFNSDEVKELFKEQEALLRAKEKGLELLTELKSKEKQFPSTMDENIEEKVTYVLNDAIKNINLRNKTDFVDEFYDTEKARIFVATSKFPGARDEILYNNAKNNLKVKRKEAVKYQNGDSIGKIIDPKTNKERRIKKGDVLSKGTVLIKHRDVDKVILDTDATVLNVDYINNKVYLISEKLPDEQIKIVTNEGNKGPLKTGYKTTADVDFIVNQETMAPQKYYTSGNTPIKPEDFTTIKIKDSHNKEIEVKGYFIDSVIPTISEDDDSYKVKNTITSILGSKEGYAVDLLHYTSDSKTIPMASIAGGWFLTKEDGKLKWDPTRVQNLAKNIPHPERLMHTHNAIDAIQYWRMAYMLNLLTEPELQKEFNTNLSKMDIIKNKLNDVRVASEQYNGEINYFKEKYEDRINRNNTFINKMFSPLLTDKFIGNVSTKVTKVNPDNITSKRDIKNQTTYDNGKKTSLTVKGEVDSAESRDYENNFYKSYTDFYINSLTALNYLFDHHGYNISNNKLLDLTKRGLANYGRFYHDAWISNKFKDTDIEYVQEKMPYDIQRLGHQIYRGDPKTAIMEHPSHYNIQGNPKVEPSLTSDNYLISHNSNIENNSLASIILSENTKPINNNLMVYDVLFSLGKLNPNMSKEELLRTFSNKYNQYTISQRLPHFEVDDEGGIKLTMTDANFLTGSAKEIEKAVRSTVKDFNYMYKVFNNKENADFDTLMTSIDKDTVGKHRTEYNKKVSEFNETADRIYKKLVSPSGEITEDFNTKDFAKERYNSMVTPPRVSSDGNKTLVFNRDPLLMSGSGLKESESKEAMGIARAVKRRYSKAIYIAQGPLNKVDIVKREMNRTHMSQQDFNSFVKLNTLFELKSRDPERFKLQLDYLNMTEADFTQELPKLKEYADRYATVVGSYNDYVKTVKDLSDKIKTDLGEPVPCIATLMCPYKSNDPAINKSQVSQSIKGLININNYDPILNTKVSMSFDFFNSSKAIINELANMYSVIEIKDSLKDLELIGNDHLINSVNDMLDNLVLDDKVEISKYGKDSEELINKTALVMNVIEDYTKLNTKDIKSHSVIEQYREVYKALDYELAALKDKFAEEYDGFVINSYSDAQKIMSNSDSLEMRKSAEAIQNYIWAKMICGQGIIETSPQFAKNFDSFLNTLAGEGKSLVNAFGQKYERNSFLVPFGSTSMANLQDNLGIAYNSKNPVIWNQYMLEKIITGDIYILDNKVADYLNDNVYTHKNPSRITKQLQNISKLSSAIQMSLPSRLLNRLISFTGFDYAMSTLYNPMSIGQMGRARKELLAAYQSKGASLKDNPILERYFELEGQPIGLTGKDPITFTEDISAPEKLQRVLNTLTDPLEFQNHLGRYALYLTALEGFEKGDPWYGPVYYKKDVIDTLPSNQDKAMYIVDYMLGTPGGFPLLSKKTSGYMLYATFPMAFTRTLGAWGMSLGRLAKEGFTESNGKDWMRTVAVPSAGLLGITLLSNLITSFICNLYGIEEEEEEKMIQRRVTIDPIGTALGGTPTASSSSMNPLQNFEEMFITPFKDETYQHGKDYNSDPSMWKKLLGFTNSNITSHLNPAIKTPIEIVSGKDIYGASPIDTKYYYTGLENAIRKLAGFFIGSTTANEIVNQNKMDMYTENPSFLDSLLKGIRRGISYSIGNQKTYKKDTTNYYNNIYKVNNYKYATSNSYEAETEDLLDADFLETKRSFSDKYGAYNYDDYKRISNIMKKMIHSKAEPAQVYGLITAEYNKGVSESTLRAVLNNNSLIRKLERIDTQAFLKTLTGKETQHLINAIEYEERMYPMLNDFFPNKPYTKKPYIKNYRPPYIKGGNNYSKLNYYPSYRPGYNPYYRYPTSYNSYKRYNNYIPKYHLDKQEVHVSPEMSIWSRDFNEIKDLKKPITYLDNQFYNGLSSWEKKKKGSDY